MVDHSESEGCWACDAEVPANANYCTQCAAPLSDFQARKGDGFLSDNAETYLRAVVRENVSYPSDSSLSDDLEESLQLQLKADTRKAVQQLGLLCVADEELLWESVDTSSLSDVQNVEDIDFDEVSPSFAGFVGLVDGLASMFPPEVFEENYTENE